MDTKDEPSVVLRNMVSDLLRRYQAFLRTLTRLTAWNADDHETK